MVSFVIMLLICVCNQALTIYLSFLIVLPLIYTNTLAGFLNVAPEMLEMAETFRLSRWKKFLYIYRPSFMPFLISSCRVALARAMHYPCRMIVLDEPFTGLDQNTRLELRRGRGLRRAAQLGGDPDPHAGARAVSSGGAHP